LANPGRRQGGKLPLFPAEQETLDAIVLPEFMRSTFVWAAGRIIIFFILQNGQLA